MSLSAQVGIGTTALDASAMLQIDNTSRGVLVPRMTQVQRNAIGFPATGLLIYQTDATAGFYYYNGVIWTTFGGGSGWDILGNSGTAPASNMLGTTDVQDLSVVANGAEAIRVTSVGQVGIGTTTPSAMLDIFGASSALRIQDGNETSGYVMISDALGNATWSDSGVLGVPDNDWAFATAGITNTDPIYRFGNVVVGNSNGTNELLDIHTAGLPEVGTEIGIGSDEYILDGASETSFSHNVVPAVNNAVSCGNATFKWKDVYATNNTISTSDRRAKMNITPLSHGLNSLLKLRPVSFLWKNEVYGKTVLKDKQKKTKIGFIAQEVQKIIPEIVVANEWQQKSEKEPTLYVKQKTKRIGMRYAEVLPVVVNATKEHELLINKIIEQQDEIALLLKELK